MPHTRTVAQKLNTKLKVLEDPEYERVVKIGDTYQIDNEVFLTVSDERLTYGTKRFFPNLVTSVKEDPYTVSIVLNHDTLKYVSSNPVNPPKGARKVYDVFKRIPTLQIYEIIIGATVNSIENGVVSITKEMYDQIIGIDHEENEEKTARVFNRVVPFLSSQFHINTTDMEVDRNYQLLLQEVLASGEFTQSEIMEQVSNLDFGEPSKILIEKQISKQTEWLIDTVEEILDEDRINKNKAKELGYAKFHYKKNSIIGPEHLMERILTDFGQYSLFGVPALLNTGKYVIHEGRSRSQFDLILINHLGDIELVELKRPDDYLLEFGNGRGKFYPSTNLAIAIGQLERYITCAYKDNDDDYLIDGQKIRDFINDQVGDTIFMESIRPKGLIIMGSWKKLCKPYSDLSQAQRDRITEVDYNDDAMQAYKELKHSLKNISIMTYSELLENARTRLLTSDSEENSD